MLKAMDKTLVILMLLVVILTVPSVFVFFYERANPLEVVQIEKAKLVFKQDLRFEVDPNNKITQSEFLNKILEKEISSFDDIIKIEFSLNKVGDYLGSITVRNKDVESINRFKYVVFDDTPPVIHLLKEIITTEGNPLELKDYFEVTDNSLKEKETLNFKIEESINWYQAGTYNITVTAKDESGNVSTYETRVVVEAVPVYEIPTTPTDDNKKPEEPENPSLPEDPEEPEEPDPQEPNEDDIET